MEVEKDKRLPTGFRSWWGFFGKLPDQDTLANRHNGERVYVSRVLPIMESSEGTITEKCEYDLLSVKVRCFDEIQDLMPDIETLHSIYSRLRMVYNFEDAPELKFIKSLIDLEFYKR